MNVLVLGASGFIGGAIAQALLDRGESVRVLLRKPDATWTERGAEVHLGGLGRPQAIADAAKGVSHVINAAGIVSPNAARRALRWTHVAGTENLVNACRHAHVARLVTISCTDVTLGNVDRVHWDEGRSLAGQPFGVRAKSLQLAEELALSESDETLGVTALRASWVWGPGDTSRLPGLCREALDGGIRIVGDGATFLATTYIDHLVEAVSMALARDRAVGRAFHVVDPVFQHAREFFSALSSTLGVGPPKSLPPWVVSWPLARVKPTVGSLSAAELLQRGRSTLFDFNAAIGQLDYEPSVPMADGLRALGEWVQAQGGVAAVAALERPPPAAGTVDDQVEAAGGD